MNRYQSVSRHTPHGHFALKPGTTVPVKNGLAQYRLPPGLTPGDEVKILNFDHGYYDVERNGKRFTIFLVCVNKPNRQPAMFDREKVKETLAQLATRGVYIGTSSWKYEGWLGQLYSPGRYEYRGKVAKTRFERGCLTEYAEVFKTVGVDAAYYDFPRPEYLRKLADAVPDDFQFGFKVTDAITVKKFPDFDRFGERAGKPNPDFLNPDLFSTAFLQPCSEIREKVGVLMFEFSRFWPSDYEHGRDFVSDLDRFFSQLPKDWRYAIEMRNRHWLRDEYFACLARHDVTHVFNSWTEMPPISEQMALAGSRTNPGRVAARLLLKPGRKYEDAVKAFQPYDKTHEVNEDARAAAVGLILEGERFEPRRKTYIYVNNRLEGNALETIAAILEAWTAGKAEA